MQVSLAAGDYASALHHLSQGSYLAEKILLHSPLSDWMLSLVA